MTKDGRGPGAGPDDRPDANDARAERLRRRHGWAAARGWQRGGAFGRERPDWWPAQERWPPARRGPPWSHRRSPLARGFGCLFGLVFLVGFIGILSIVFSLVMAAGPIGHGARVIGLVILGGLIIAMASAARRFRRTAFALDDLVDAARRVEQGDYSTRVDVPSERSGPVRDLSRGFNAMAATLEADEVQRRRLLADVSHELRTPLAVVQGNIEAMIDGVHAPDEAHLAAILEETHVLTRLVDDLRTIALSDAGALALHREPTDLAILATDAAAIFRPAAEAAKVDLTVDIGDDVPLLDVDPVRIREVISNLVANALRHTPAGGTVAIDARVGDVGRAVVVTVRDSGSGIGPELLPHVFDRFAKSAGSRGSGLGLAIARGLVEAHGGSIDVDSAPGRGSAFTFRIPIED